VDKKKRNKMLFVKEELSDTAGERGGNRGENYLKKKDM
jgi:hypothetical protein